MLKLYDFRYHYPSWRGYHTRGMTLVVYVKAQGLSFDERLMDYETSSIDIPLLTTSEYH